MARGRWRRLAGAYLALFFVAVAASPHQHVNDLEDILLDQPSNSGVFVETSGLRTSSPAVAPLRIIHDVSCLACFTRDFVGVPLQTVMLSALLTPLPPEPERPTLRAPELVAAETCSRAPPASF